MTAAKMKLSVRSVLSAAASALFALAPLVSHAVTKTYRVDTGEVAYLEGAKTIDSATKSYVTPKGTTYFSPNGAGVTFTAVPPQGCQLRKDEKQWVLFSLNHVNGYTTLTGPTEYGQLPDNPGYTVTVTNSSTLSKSSFKETAPDVTSTYNTLILAPCFQWIRYNLVYNGNCASFPGDYFGNESGNKDIVYTNTVVTASPTWTRNYYTLKGFSTNSVATEADFGLGETVQNAGEAFGVTAPQMLTNPVVRLYAVWEPRQFTVTLDPNGTGATVSPASFTITGDETCPALPVPVRFGFVSDGWYLEDGTSSAFNTRVEQGYDFPGTEDLTLYAKWIARELVITLDANGGQLTGGATTGSITITGANPCPSLPEPTRAYHDFAGWFRSDGVTQVQAGDDIEDTEPFTLYAHWDPVVRTITLDAGDGRFADGTATTNITVSGSETCPALPEPTRANYDFLRWLDGETEVKQGDDIPADVTLTAKWERKSMASYIVTLVYWNAEGEQSVQQLVNRGANAVEPEDFDTRVGYSFVDWDDSLENITSNKTITALYDPNIYSVSFDGNGGSGSVAGGYRTYDVAWELPANGFTNGDRAFLGWSTNAAEAVAENCWQPGATVSNLTAEANGTATVYAIWAATVYSVKFAWHDADGWVTNEVLVTEEHAATVPGEFDAAAWTGHTFTGWDAEIPSSVTENAILTAQYSTNAYTVSFDANGGEGTMDDQAFVYDVPQALSLNGFTRTGTYEFYCWADAAETNSGAAIFFDGATVSNLTAEAGGAVTLYAQWRDTSELSDLAKEIGRAHV